jgi:RNA polymerase sigma-70 factor (ECF subfamily)
VKDELDVGALSRRYGPMVLRRCRRLLRDDDEALDACQDVFLLVIEHRARLNAQYPSSLLFRMATNVCLNRIRDRGRRPEEVDDERLQTIARLEEPGGGSHARLLLDWLFARHPESTRTIAVLHYVDGLTLEQVASECGMSVSGIRKRLNKLRQDIHDGSSHPRRRDRTVSSRRAASEGCGADR